MLLALALVSTAGDWGLWLISATLRVFGLFGLVCCYAVLAASLGMLRLCRDSPVVAWFGLVLVAVIFLVPDFLPL